MSWLDNSQKGFDAQLDDGFKKSPTANMRFFLKQGTEKKIVFLSEEPIIIYEHSPKIGKIFNNFATCLTYLEEDCPLCKVGDNPTQVAIFTILDATGYTDKEGNTHKNFRCLFVAKKPTYELLSRRVKKLQERGKQLRGALFEVARNNQKTAPKVGNDFEYERHVDLDGAKQKGIEIEEFDYEELLKPDPDLAKHFADQYAKQELGQETVIEDTPGASKPSSGNAQADPLAEAESATPPQVDY